MSDTLKSNPTLEDGYQAMANDEEREAEALEWAEATIGDVADDNYQVKQRVTEGTNDHPKAIR